MLISFWTNSVIFRYFFRYLKKGVYARNLKLGQLIGDDVLMTKITFGQIPVIFFGVIAL